MRFLQIYCSHILLLLLFSPSSSFAVFFSGETEKIAEHRFLQIYCSHILLLLLFSSSSSFAVFFSGEIEKIAKHNVAGKLRNWIGLLLFCCVYRNRLQAVTEPFQVGSGKKM
ncbi:hypothetical protein RchiOBHm_Chr3g0463631 [Rosa chinensis]|uniref:Secreted protein n=1 Tax=Rosa chinensis TaxID=74649 RepID=A0A2P6R981_ROSCH|nr:hypothetical protein RchiOBHm_Chr3g0463631 [Rosa chinensis]